MPFYFPSPRYSPSDLSFEMPLSPARNTLTWRFARDGSEHQSQGV